MLRESPTLRKAGERFGEARDMGRVPVSAKANMRLDDGTYRSVEVLNLSLGGIGMRMLEPLSVGTQFHLDLESGALRVSGIAKIIWSRPGVAGGHDAGAEFVT